MRGDGWLGGMGDVGAAMGVLLMAALVALLVWGAGALASGRAGTGTPSAILRRRYAAGEISPGEYEQARRDARVRQEAPMALAEQRTEIATRW